MKALNRIFALVFFFLCASALPAETSTKILTENCIVCHGNEGVSPAGTFPSLAGQTSSYLYKQLKMIQSGKRDVPTMIGQLDRYSDAELRRISDYYSRLEPPKLVAENEALELGESLYRFGDLDKGIPACTACHGPSGKGLEGPGYPALAGQWKDYTLASLKRFETVTEKDPGYLMRTIALKLNVHEREALANYIQGLRDN